MLGTHSFKRSSALKCVQFLITLFLLLIFRFSTEKAIILKCLQSKRAVKTETTV